VWLNVLESITQSVTDRGGVIAMVLKELAKWRGTASSIPQSTGWAAAVAAELEAEAWGRRRCRGRPHLLHRSTVVGCSKGACCGDGRNGWPPMDGPDHVEIVLGHTL
jgi:hypothetical protein